MDNTTTDLNSTKLVVQLPEALTIDSVEAVASQLQNLTMSEGDHIIMDASATEIMTTPAMQLLLALENTLKHRGGSLFISHPKANVIENFQTLGLGEHIARWNVA